MKDLNNLDISDIDFNNMGSWPAAAKVVVAAMVFVVVCFLGYQLVISDQITQLEGLETKEGQLKRDYEKKQEKAANLDEYKGQMVIIQDSFKTLLQQLPKRSEMAGLIDELSYAATGAGCELVSADFQAEKKMEVFSEKPISLVVSGGYHQLANFVSRVSRLPRIVTLHDFEIKIGDGEVAASPGEKILIMSVTAKTYRSDTEEG